MAQLHASTSYTTMRTSSPGHATQPHSVLNNVLICEKSNKKNEKLIVYLIICCKQEDLLCTVKCSMHTVSKYLRIF